MAQCARKPWETNHLTNSTLHHSSQKDRAPMPHLGALPYKSLPVTRGTQFFLHAVSSRMADRFGKVHLSRQMDEKNWICRVCHQITFSGCTNTSATCSGHAVSKAARECRMCDDTQKGFADPCPGGVRRFFHQEFSKPVADKSSTSPPLSPASFSQRQRVIYHSRQYMHLAQSVEK